MNKYKKEESYKFVNEKGSTVVIDTYNHTAKLTDIVGTILTHFTIGSAGCFLVVEKKNEQHNL